MKGISAQGLVSFLRTQYLDGFDKAEELSNKEIFMSLSDSFVFSRNIRNNFLERVILSGSIEPLVEKYELKIIDKQFVVDESHKPSINLYN